MRFPSLLPRLALVSILGVLSLHAQNAEREVPRNFRFLVIGEYPPPYFERRGGDWVEVDPPAKLIPPSMIMPILEAGSSQTGKQPPELSLRFNQIVTLSQYRCPTKLRLSLKKSTAAGGGQQEISCEVGNMIEPMVMIFADTQRGWEQPQVRVVDFSPNAFPANSTHISNFTPFALGVRIEDTKAALAPSQQQILKTARPTGQPFRFRVDISSGTAVAPLANSSYQLQNTERLVIVAVPDATVKDRPPVTVRTITDRLTPPASNAPR